MTHEKEVIPTEGVGPPGPGSRPLDVHQDYHYEDVWPEDVRRLGHRPDTGPRVAASGGESKKPKGFHVRGEDVSDLSRHSEYPCESLKELYRTLETDSSLVPDRFWNPDMVI